MTFVVNAAIPGGQSGLFGDPLHTTGNAVPFQPSDEGEGKPELSELENCVTKGLVKGGELELEVNEALALILLLLRLDDIVELDVRFSDEVVLTNGGGVGIRGTPELVTVVVEGKAEVLQSDEDDCVDVTGDEEDPKVGFVAEVAKVLPGIDNEVVIMAVDAGKELGRLVLWLVGAEDDRLVAGVDSVPVAD
jgi:hypothetical protein